MIFSVKLDFCLLVIFKGLKFSVSVFYSYVQNEDIITYL